MALPVLLLILSNIFMTYAWYGHLKHLGTQPLWLAILASWGIAFFEYCLQVPANRLGFQQMSLPQLKVLQEVTTLVVFAVFAWGVMGTKPNLNWLWAGFCLVGAVFFVFREA
jgi:uncharacterized protein (DUF486 family)